MVGKIVRKYKFAGKIEAYSVLDYKTRETINIDREDLVNAINDGKIILTNTTLDKAGRIIVKKVNITYAESLSDTWKKYCNNESCIGELRTTIEYILDKLNLKYTDYMDSKHKLFYILANDIIEINLKKKYISSKFSIITPNTEVVKVLDFLSELSVYNKIDKDIKLNELAEEALQHDNFRKINRDMIKCKGYTLKFKNKPGVYKIKTPKTKGEFIKIKTMKELKSLV